MNNENTIYTGQRRAKVGGEVGANGEWYDGGKFIATEAHTIKSAAPYRPTLSDAEIAERAERKAREEAEHAVRVVKLAEIAAQVSDIADRLADGRGGFCDSIASDLRRGVIPQGKPYRIMVEILAKQEGRGGSKAYHAAVDTLEARLEPLAAKYDSLYA